MDWLELLTRFGLPVAIIVAIGWFVVARVWPFVVSAYEGWHEDRKEEREAFLRAIAEERMAFRGMLDAERTLRIQERDQFLEVLERQRQNFQVMLREQEGSTRK